MAPLSTIFAIDVFFPITKTYRKPSEDEETTLIRSIIYVFFVVNVEEHEDWANWKHIL